jgi:hypothetical protein
MLFRHERHRPTPEIWEREHAPKPAKIAPPPRPPLGYSRQPRANTQKAELIRAKMALERAQNELRLTGKLGWIPPIDSSARVEPKAEAEIDFQRYADGEDW